VLYCFPVDVGDAYQVTSHLEVKNSEREHIADTIRSS